MTYWCDGVKRTAAILKKAYPSVPLFLGGTLATLCEEYAKNIPGVDEVLTGPFCKGHLQKILNALGIFSGINFPENPEWPLPAFDLLNPDLKHGALVSSFGCPFQCTYCASKKMSPVFYRRPPEAIIEQIKQSRLKGIVDFAFYDDALLYRYENHLGIILENLNQSGISVRFHTPNGMHARWINKKSAKDLFSCGFQILRIGFETDVTAAQKNTGGKVTSTELEQAIAHLREAGFKKNQIGVYLIVGLNGESWQETIPRAKWVQSLGAKALPNFLSPVPYTKDFLRLSEQYPVLKEDPKTHNDLFFALYSNTVNYEEFQKLKKIIREGNA
jgi:radical SAM superfamily enzyme YgiQ (UPF0313 family)